MLTASKLRVLADAADHLASLRRGAGAPYAEIQPLDIAANDARRVADAGSGYGTPETLALDIAFNDRETVDRRDALVREALATDYPDETPEDAEALRISHLADALAELVEELAGFEGIALGEHGFHGFAGSAERRLTVDLPDVAAALARAAFRNVDWIGWARHYVQEARLNG